VNKSRSKRWAGNVAHMGRDEKCTQILVRKPEGKEPFGTALCRWMNHIGIDLLGTGFNWQVLKQAFINRIMNIQIGKKMAVF
jgi:hypothetical protein